MFLLNRRDNSKILIDKTRNKERKKKCLRGKHQERQRMDARNRRETEIDHLL